MQRLQKLLARAGWGSRRTCEEIITAGRVTVNGETITKMGARASADDDIRVDGQRITLFVGHVHLMLNKPPGYITTRSDPQGRTTVMDLIADELRMRVFPVGRLDLDTTGLLLLTDDGDLSQRLIHPSHHVTKEYVVDVEGTPSERTLHSMRHGMKLEDGFTQPCEVTLLETGHGESRLRMIIGEGRNRQVRRMFEMVGHPVRRLKRVAMGPLRLGELSLGEVRELSKGQLAALREAVQLPPIEDETPQ